MSFIDALKIGNKMRRKSWPIDKWMSVDSADALTIHLSRQDWLADDWEPLKEPRTFTLARNETGEAFILYNEQTIKPDERVRVREILE